jgi:hypothetical protein
VVDDDGDEHDAEGPATRNGAGRIRFVDTNCVRSRTAPPPTSARTADSVFRNPAHEKCE